ncbi:MULTISPECIES: gamma-glutamyltransferase [unclassified Niallia]|uniref:gamma-glutamyltransferase n=1 Tax=unclassified Niallia TaxID=2837522 RepID=UPI001EDAC8FC|nr:MULTISPECIES: gamma-glutamyltransferase [unclassified Niallia]MCM3029873.1 gamma-glutamyltransferase [Niallia sp. MER 6]MDL0436660.1 gamma-glutamyltransferase [Niallia sp. SS-2023]UPO86834.1 gamma-glutamyltransferase [Niallia sp. Man26]
MKKVIVGTKSMVVSPHYLASQAGERILQQGGNAFDAAVAVSACLAVVYPHMTGLGGDSFWLAYHAEKKKVRSYNGSGRSGSKVTRDKYKGKEAIPFRGIESVITVPGMVDSWDAVLREYGRMSLKEVLAPAIEYAENGFPVSNDQYENTVKSIELLQSDKDMAKVFLPEGKVPNTFSKFVQKNLGCTLQSLADKGRDDFYKGDLAKRIISSIQKKGGLLTEQDFAAHQGEWTEPLSSTYRDYTIFQVPPNSQGFVGLMILNILENFDLSAIPHESYEYYHLLVEAVKKSFQDRNNHLTDPVWHNIPLEKLLSKEYAKELAASISFDHTCDLPTQPVGSDTAHAAVVDEDGNAVSFIQSLYFEFGSGIIAGDTGITMQNRGSFFSLDADHINALEPNKRTFHTLMPAMAFKEDKPYVLYGTQGGEGQPQTQTVMITRMLDYGMDPQAAISGPRFVWGRTWGEKTQELKIEGRVANDVLEKLQKLGHSVNRVDDYAGIMGHANAILIDEQGFFYGGVDPRSDGAAVGR